jgi:hypothetical protein
MSQSIPNQEQPIALVVDTSSSATSSWDETRRTAESIRLLLQGVAQVTLYALGNRAEISPNTLKQSAPPGFSRDVQACSLIAPVMEALSKPHSLIVVGSGEIFDLEDWGDAPCANRWLLVNTSEFDDVVFQQPLQAPSGRFPEISPSQIRDADTLLSYINTLPKQTGNGAFPEEGANRSYHGRVNIDGSGYPLIYVEPLGSFVHLFPVTKAQFERFITSANKPGFGDAWYAERLRMNPRASYTSHEPPNLDNLFITGITVDEAASFSKWLGRRYSLLSKEGWRTCYEWLGTQAAGSAPSELSERLAGDALAIWEIVHHQCRERQHPPTLRELSLMTRGVLEWVVELEGRYCGVGEPASSIHIRKAFDPVRPLGTRLKNLGFRLYERLA